MADLNPVFIIEQEDNSFVLELLSTDDHGYAFAEFAISVCSSGYSGKNPSVWFDHQDLHQFFDELKLLDIQRQGTATLETLSKLSEVNELTLQIYSIDKLGHMAVNVMLQ